MWFDWLMTVQAPYLLLRSNLIDNLRRTSGLTTDQALARACDLDPAEISRVKRNPRNPPGRVLAAIAKNFGLSLGEIAIIAGGIQPTPEPEPETPTVGVPEFLK